MATKEQVEAFLKRLKEKIIAEHKMNYPFKN